MIYLLTGTWELSIKKLVNICYSYLAFIRAFTFYHELNLLHMLTACEIHRSQMSSCALDMDIRVQYRSPLLRPSPTASFNLGD